MRRVHALTFLLASWNFSSLIQWYTLVLRSWTAFGCMQIYLLVHHLHYCDCDYRIPIIGGRDLDLHKLFLEVTSRGGIEKVTSNHLTQKIWQCASFYIFLLLAYLNNLLVLKYFLQREGIWWITSIIALAFAVPLVISWAPLLEFLKVSLSPNHAHLSRRL